MADDDHADALLDRTGFDADESVLTRRQAEVLALRERGLTQATVGERLGTSRANVSAVERAARENVSRARETAAFADALAAPVKVAVEAGDDLYDVPSRVYDAADTADVKVDQTTTDLRRTVATAAAGGVDGGRVREPLLVCVTDEGTVRVRRRR
jgi:Tfx family DNA-binding protein